MTNKERSLKNLQKALSMELTAVHQYLLHAHVLDDWGLDKLGAKMREEMQEELGHASVFIERILYLQGEPVVSEQKAPKRAESLEALFTSDLKEENKPSLSTPRPFRRRWKMVTSAPRRFSNASFSTRKVMPNGLICSSTCSSGWANRPSFPNT